MPSIRIFKAGPPKIPSCTHEASSRDHPGTTAFLSETIYALASSHISKCWDWSTASRSSSVESALSVTTPASSFERMPRETSVRSKGPKTRDDPRAGPKISSVFAIGSSILPAEAVA